MAVFPVNMPPISQQFFDHVKDTFRPLVLDADHEITPEQLIWYKAGQQSVVSFLGRYVRTTQIGALDVSPNRHS